MEFTHWIICDCATWYSGLLWYDKVKKFLFMYIRKYSVSITMSNIYLILKDIFWKEKIIIIKLDNNAYCFIEWWYLKYVTIFKKIIMINLTLIYLKNVWGFVSKVKITILLILKYFDHLIRNTWNSAETNTSYLPQ